MRLPTLQPLPLEPSGMRFAQLIIGARRILLGINFVNPMKEKISNQWKLREMEMYPLRKLTMTRMTTLAADDLTNKCIMIV